MMKKAGFWRPSCTFGSRFLVVVVVCIALGFGCSVKRHRGSPGGTTNIQIETAHHTQPATRGARSPKEQKPWAVKSAELIANLWEVWAKLDEIEAGAAADEGKGEAVFAELARVLLAENAWNYLWLLWLASGRAYLADLACTNDLDTLPDVLRKYERHIRLNGHRDAGPVHMEGLKEAVELVKAEFWAPALCYVWRVVLFDSQPVPSQPLMMMQSDPQAQQRMYRALKRWLAINEERMRWMTRAYGDFGLFVAEGNRSFRTTDSLKEVIRIWKRSKLIWQGVEPVGLP